MNWIDFGNARTLNFFVLAGLCGRCSVYSRRLCNNIYRMMSGGFSSYYSRICMSPSDTFYILLQDMLRIWPFLLALNNPGNIESQRLPKRVGSTAKIQQTIAHRNKLTIEQGRKFASEPYCATILRQVPYIHVVNSPKSEGGHHYLWQTIRRIATMATIKRQQYNASLGRELPSTRPSPFEPRQCRSQRRRSLLELCPFRKQSRSIT